MAKNNSKPYNDKKNTKNSKNSSKKKNIENTTKIRIDRERLNDSESLDTSFLEGRFSKKVPSSKEKRDLLISEKSKKIQRVELLKKLFYSLSIFCILVLGIMAFFANNPITLFHKKERLEEPIAIQKADDTLDRNYLFVGDYHTDEFDFSLYHYDYHYVKVSSDDMTASVVSNQLRDFIYQYNPSIVFLQLGMNDLQKGESFETILKSFHKIVDGIQANRPYATIYVESLYPINPSNPYYNDGVFGDLDNSDIQQFNEELKELCEEQKIEYLDIFQELVENGALKDSYTDDGILLNDNGYRRLVKVINRVIEAVEQ